jgi:FkbM family methyltransferase
MQLIKGSLKSAIGLFKPHERVILIVGLFLKKVRIDLGKYFHSLFILCNKYVTLIETGVSFKYKGRGLIQAQFEVNGKLISALLRIGSSDLSVFESVIIRGDYDVILPSIIGKENEIYSIIDAGGNIGISTIYLHAFLPNSNYYIIEPDRGNLLMLDKNLRLNNITNIFVFPNAVWTSNEFLSITTDFRDGRHWSLSVKKSDIQDSHLLINGVTLRDICEKNNMKNNNNILKMDIEGAERFLFENDDFLKVMQEYVAILIIEIHDEFKIRESIYSKMNKMGYRLTESDMVVKFERSLFQ